MKTIYTLSAKERDEIREAVREASVRSKLNRERRSLPAQSFPVAEADRDWAKAVEADAADIFVDVMVAALRRRGAWIVFLE